jgi:Fe-S-cluster containining protein
MPEHIRHDNEGSRGCARCGHCCAPVWLPWPLEQQQQAWRAGVRPTSPNWPFIGEHWHVEWVEPKGGRIVTCDMFDPDKRICTAGEARPPICSDYPFYGENPVTREAGMAGKYPDPLPHGYGWYPHETGPGDAPLSCSYLGDVPPDMRPAGAGRPLIPIFPVEEF